MREKKTTDRKKFKGYESHIFLFVFIIEIQEAIHLEFWQRLMLYY